MVGEWDTESNTTSRFLLGEPTCTTTNLTCQTTGYLSNLASRGSRHRGGETKQFRRASWRAERSMEWHQVELIEPCLGKPVGRGVDGRDRKREDHPRKSWKDWPPLKRSLTFRVHGLGSRQRCEGSRRKSTQKRILACLLRWTLPRQSIRLQDPEEDPLLWRVV
jgi:hypothetical protein